MKELGDKEVKNKVTQLVSGKLRKSQAATIPNFPRSVFAHLTHTCKNGVIFRWFGPHVTRHVMSPSTE